MNRQSIMKTIYLLPIALLLFGCDSGKSVQSTPPQAAAVAPVEQQKPVQDKTAESKLHFNQAFSYIGSAKAAATVEAKEKLLLSAEIELNNAIEKDPANVQAWLNRGVTYIALGKPNKAEDDLKKAASMEPKNNAVHYNLACLYSTTKKLDLAADSLNLALANGFNDSDSLRNDPDLADLRKTKEFRQILEKHKIFIN